MSSISNISSPASVRLQPEDATSYAFASVLVINVQNVGSTLASRGNYSPRELEAAEALTLIGFEPKLAAEHKTWKELSKQTQEEIELFACECIEKNGMTRKAAHHEIMKKYNVVLALSRVNEWALDKRLTGVRQKKEDKLKPLVLDMWSKPSATCSGIARKLDLNRKTVTKWIENAVRLGIAQKRERRCFQKEKE